MATHSSTPAWRIPGTEEPVGLLSMGLHRVGHDWHDLAAAAIETLNSLRNHQTVFHSNPTIYISANNGWDLKFSSVVSQFSGSVVSNSLRPHRLQQFQASLSITNSQSLLKLSSVVRRIIIVSQGLTTPCMWSDGNSAVLHSRCRRYPAHYSLHTTVTHQPHCQSQSWGVLTTRDCFNHT